MGALQAGAALALVDAGVMSIDDVPARTRHIDAACVAAVTRRVKRFFAGLKVLEIEVGVSFERARKGSPAGSIGTCQIDWASRGTLGVVVGPAVERLERLRKGLGAGVLSVLERASWDSLPILHFGMTLGMAQWFAWHGCSSPAEYAREMGLNGEDAGEYEASCMTKEQVERDLPTWATSRRHGRRGRRDLPSVAVLERLLARCRDDYLRQVLAAAAAVAKENERTAASGELCFHRRQDDGGEFIGWGAALRWSRKDSLLDIAQMAGQYGMEGGEGYVVCNVMVTDLCGTELAEAFELLEADARRVRLLDRLIALLARRTWKGKAIQGTKDGSR